eukprot:2609761-Amphidinium_carterae.1
MADIYYYRGSGQTEAGENRQVGFSPNVPLHKQLAKSKGLYKSLVGIASQSDIDVAEVLHQSRKAALTSTQIAEQEYSISTLGLMSLLLGYGIKKAWRAGCSFVLKAWLGNFGNGLWSAASAHVSTVYPQLNKGSCKKNKGAFGYGCEEANKCLVVRELALPLYAVMATTMNGLVDASLFDVEAGRDRLLVGPSGKRKRRIDEEFIQQFSARASSATSSTLARMTGDLASSTAVSFDNRRLFHYMASCQQTLGKNLHYCCSIDGTTLGQPASRLHASGYNLNWDGSSVNWQVSPICARQARTPMSMLCGQQRRMLELDIVLEYQGILLPKSSKTTSYVEPMPYKGSNLVVVLSMVGLSMEHR